MSEVKIVFFLNTRVSEKYAQMYDEYLEDIKQSGIENDPESYLDIVMVGNEETLRKVVSQTQSKLECNLNFYHHEDSFYEHEGIKHFYQTCVKSDDDDLVIYSHCRSLSHKPFIRDTPSKVCSKLILTNYQKNKKFMMENKHIDKLGVCQSNRGFMWYNFFMTRPKYVRSLRPVTDLLECRHAYERWLGDNKLDNGYSIMFKECGFQTGAAEIENEMHKRGMSYL